MATEIKVPSLGESVTEATVAKWLKRPGEAVAVDEPVAELETDKVTLEVPRRRPARSPRSSPRRAPTCRSAQCSAGSPTERAGSRSPTRPLHAGPPSPRMRGEGPASRSEGG